MRSCLLLLALLPGSLVPEILCGQEPGRKYALVVGVCFYKPGQLKSLKFPTADARSMEAALKHLGFDVVTMTHDAQDPHLVPRTPTSILKAVQRLAKNKQPEDKLIVYLSGHGVQLKNDPVDDEGRKETYFCPAMTDLGKPQTLLPLSQVYAELIQSQAVHKVLLIDACRSDVGPSSRGENPAQIEKPTRGLKRPRVPDGLAVLFSCHPDQASYELADLKAGAFTYFAVQYLKGRAEGQVYPDGAATVMGLSNYAGRATYNRIKKEVAADQFPSLDGNFTPWEIGQLPIRGVEMTVAVDLPMTETGAGRPTATLRAGQQVIVQKTRGSQFLVSRLGGRKQGWVDATGLRYRGGSITNSLGMKLCYIPPGVFRMGSPRNESGRKQDEQQHQIRLRQGYYLSATEVTVGQFKRFVQATGYITEAERDREGGYGWDGRRFVLSRRFSWRSPGFAQTDDHPVVNVTWDDAQAFLKWLSKEEKQSYRLPIEAEWEHACRAGSTTAYWSGSDLKELPRVGNLAEDLRQAADGTLRPVRHNAKHAFTAPVGQYEANRFGLYDTHGNVWEWCENFYRPNYLDPAHLQIDRWTLRVSRGGGWDSPPLVARSAKRNRSLPDLNSSNIGFRVVRLAQ